MAITNREIITNQVNRIKEKTGAKVTLIKKPGGLYTLCKSGTENGEYPPQAPEEFCRTMTWRTSAQMIGYLAGLEDAIDAMPKRVYFIKCEVNDHGWTCGFHHFAKLEDAISTMRNHVARKIWNARQENKEIFFKVFSDSVMGDVSTNPQRSQTIFVRINHDTFEYRVWSEELNYSELPKDKCFNY